MMRFTKLVVPMAVLSLALMSGIANAKNNGKGKHGGMVSSVPELSLGAAGGALVLLVGGTLIARGRRRRADKA